jgi:hypothetical protein
VSTVNLWNPAPQSVIQVASLRNLSPVQLKQVVNDDFKHDAQVLESPQVVVGPSLSHLTTLSTVVYTHLVSIHAVHLVPVTLLVTESVKRVHALHPSPQLRHLVPDLINPVLAVQSAKHDVVDGSKTLPVAHESFPSTSYPTRTPSLSSLQKLVAKALAEHAAHSQNFEEFIFL